MSLVKKTSSEMFDKVYDIRFEIFLTTQLMILFGALFVPLVIFDKVVLPTLILVNIFSGIIIVAKKKKLAVFLSALILVSIIVLGSELFSRDNDGKELLRLLIYAIFHSIVTYQIVTQVWLSKKKGKSIIIGLMCGYLSLGFLAFSLFLSIELYNPNSFHGTLLNNASFSEKIDSLMYYAYVTLLTIGYGEITPATLLAQKASVLIGLLGQFYTVIITAVVVEKYIMNSNEN